MCAGLTDEDHAVGEREKQRYAREGFRKTVWARVARCPGEGRTRTADWSREAASERGGRTQSTEERGLMDEGEGHKESEGLRSSWAPLCREGCGAGHKVQPGSLTWGEGSPGTRQESTTPDRGVATG